MRQGRDAVDRPSHLHRVADEVEPALARDAELAHQRFLGNGPDDFGTIGGDEGIGFSRPNPGGGSFGQEPMIVAIQPQPEALYLHGPDRLLQALLECSADAHRLADRFHLGRKGLVGFGELLEGPARHLGDDVVDRRLKARAGRARDIVPQLVQRVPHRELGRDAGDGEPRGLGRQGGAARHARIHLDDDHLAVARVDGKLDVGAARIDADRSHDGDRRVSHSLVFLVRQRLDWGHGDRVARMDAHRVDILDAADNHTVVLAVANDFQLELLPPDDGLIDLDLADHGGVDPTLDQVLKFVAVVGDAAAGPPHRERGAEDHGQTDLVKKPPGFVQIGHRQRPWQPQADRLDHRDELLAILGPVDRLPRGPDHLDPELGQRPVVIQRTGGVQGDLAAQGRQQGINRGAVGLLLGDDLGDRFERDRLDVRAVGELRVGHDRRWVGVDQHDAVAVLPQGLARLGP